MRKFIYKLVIPVFAGNFDNSIKKNFREKIVFIVILFLTLFTSQSYSQNNITNTLGMGGFFTIKDATNTYFTLEQSTGRVNIHLGVILFGGNRFLYNYGPNSTFLGINSGNFSMTGNNNTGIGTNSLCLNETGAFNTALGSYSLNANKTGNQNTAIGHGSLYTNTTGPNNTSIGFYSLFNNFDGANNTSLGQSTLYANTSGIENTAVGSWSLSGNTTGAYNTAIGFKSLTLIAEGNYNTSVGTNSFISLSYGSNNTALGDNAGSSLTSGTNNILIGYNAQPNTATSSNEIVLGDANINTLRCATSTISSLSDARDKKNINDLNLGINFIMKLKPRIYNWDRRDWYEDNKSDGSKMQETPTAGFIAQELDEVQTSENAEWLNLVLKNNPDKLEATPGNLLPVVVKAVQDLKKENDDLKSRLIALEQKSGIQIQQSAGFFSGNINLNYLFLLLFSTAGFTFLVIKKRIKK